MATQWYLRYLWCKWIAGHDWRTVYDERGREAKRCDCCGCYYDFDGVYHGYGKG